MGMFRRRKDLAPLVVDRSMAQSAAATQDDAFGPDASDLESIEIREAIREANRGRPPLRGSALAGDQVIFTGGAQPGDRATLHGSHPDPNSLLARLIPVEPEHDN